MNKLTGKSKIVNRVLIIMALLLVVGFCSYLFYIYQFNHEEHTTVGADETSLSYVDIGGREDSSSTWLKRDFELNGKTVDLSARTIDATFYNNASYELKDWQMTFYVQGDCYINKSWNGTVEVHQNVNTDEKVQTLNLNDVDFDELTLDYVNSDGDWLIPLTKGDYFIYFPSESYHEVPIAKTFKVTYGFILYYLDEPDLTNYEVTYTYNRKITDGVFCYVMLLGVGVWIMLLLMYIVSVISYKTAVHDMEIKKNGILAMSDIYAIIYMIDIEKNELMPVSADDDSEKLRPNNLTAKEQLQNMCQYDCTEAFVDVTSEFCNLDTLADRMKDKTTVAFEYVSKTYGWCQIRFFAMDRVKDSPVSKVIFTIQVINEEKAEIEEISNRVTEAEMESKAKSTFLANISHEIRTPINTVIGLDTMILRESKDSNIKSYARDIKSAADMLLGLINGILDFSKMEAGKMELTPVEYSLKKLIYDVWSMVKVRIESKNLEFKCDVSPTIPDFLFGDNVRLKQVLINLLTNAAKYTDEGTITLSIYGKVTDDQVHLLMSVKDTGMGIKAEDMKTLTERFSRFDQVKNHNVEGTGLGLNLVVGLLEMMDSELKVISTYGEGSEFYFEVEQGVENDAPIGNLDLAELPHEIEDNYNVSFTAPEAHVLAVDDNPLNLTVIENLLKETQVQIDKADSGQTALKRTAEKKYDLIFMDHMMPEMDGIETFHRIRSQENGVNQETPVIMLTANAMKDVAEEYMKQGFADFLAKPLQPDALEEKTAKYLSGDKVKKTSKAPAKTEAFALPEISGIDSIFGVQHTGSTENLLKVMKLFSEVAGSDADELTGLYEKLKSNSEDGESLVAYRIKVHAMKSSANLMGALSLGGTALSLEKAARAERVQKILDMHPYFIEDWTEMLGNIKDYFNERDGGSEKKDYDSGLFETYLHQLETAMDAYDLLAMDELREKIAQFKLDDERTQLVEELKTAVANIDAEKTKELCHKLMK